MRCVRACACHPKLDGVADNSDIARFADSLAGPRGALIPPCCVHAVAENAIARPAVM